MIDPLRPTPPARSSLARLGRGLAVAAAAAAAGSHPAAATPPPLSAPPAASGAEADADASGDFLSGLQRSSFLLGDLFGLRPLLSRAGVSVALQETSELPVNPLGGARQGFGYEGLAQAVLQLDTQRAFGLHGGLLDVSALQIHGRNFSADNLLSLQTSSGIQADRATRLWELWYDQKLGEDDRLSIRIGQQSVDQEFVASPNGAYFVNTMFGWPAVPSYDLPGGGPAYPLSVPGLRLRYRPVNPVNVLVGVFGGSPAARTDGDAQRINATGTEFALNRGPLVFGELQYVYPALGAMVEPGDSAPLGHTYRLGAWYDAERFDDERLDDARHSLAAPGSSGVPLRHEGDFAVYGVVDQMVWRQKNNPNRSASLFGRVVAAPQADRNLLDLSVNGGVVLHGPVTGHPDDTVGAGFGYAHVGRAAAALDRDAAAQGRLAGGPATPVRGGETFLELTYLAQLRPWWQVQPDAQYVFRPGGGIAAPNDPAQAVHDELVLDLRTTVLF